MPRSNDEIILTEIRDMRKELGDHRREIEPYLKVIPVHTEQIVHMKESLQELKEKPLKQLKNLQLILVTLLSGMSLAGIIITFILGNTHKVVGK